MPHYKREATLHVSQKMVQYKRLSNTLDIDHMVGGDIYYIGGDTL